VLGHKRHREHGHRAREQLHRGAGAQVHRRARPLLVKRAAREPEQPEREQAEPRDRAATHDEVVPARHERADQRQPRAPPAGPAQPLAQHRAGRHRDQRGCEAEHERGEPGGHAERHPAVGRAELHALQQHPRHDEVAPRPPPARPGRPRHDGDPDEQQRGEQEPPDGEGERRRGPGRDGRREVAGAPEQDEERSERAL